MDEYKYISKSEADTIAIAENIESEKFPGMVICLNGELGSGKTVFTKGFAISIVTEFIFVKSGTTYQNEKFQELEDNCKSFENKIVTITDNIAKIESTLESISSEWKSTKENSSYLYTTVSSLQKDVNTIKEKLNIETEKVDEQTEKLAPEKRAFLEAFETLIKDGAPFESFIESNSAKIDMTKYHSSKELIKLSKQNVKSLADLKKDYSAAGNAVFKTNFEESFWERQKRLIKEKISEAIKIRKFDKDSTPKDEVNLDSDRTKFEKAGLFLSDGKYADAVKMLDSIKTENEVFGKFLTDTKKRLLLEETFDDFKKEFLQIESAGSDSSSFEAAQDQSIQK